MALLGWITVALALIAVGAVANFVLTLHVWECCRYVRKRLTLTPGGKRFAEKPELHAIVFAPCKGWDLDLEQNLAGLFRQQYGDYELVFIVESEQDEAVPVIRMLANRHPHIATHLVIAGLAEGCGQKVHNLRVATAVHGSRADVLAFVDSDARPNERWLRMLVGRLAEREFGVGAVSGYRWFTPERCTLSNLAVYVCNSTAAGALGGHHSNLAWGGSWAISRAKFEACRIRERWQGVLSDDLMASQVLWQNGLHISFEPHCIAASPIDMTWSQAIEFLRRQFFMGRRYASGHWWLGQLVTALTQLGWWFSMGLATYWTSVGQYPLAGFAACAFAVNVAATYYRGWLRQDVARRRFGNSDRRLRAARWFDLWLHPLIGPVNWFCLLSSAIGTSVTWRGIRYRVARGGVIESVEHLRGGVPPATSPTAPHVSLPLNAAASRTLAERARQAA